MSRFATAAAVVVFALALAGAGLFARAANVRERAQLRAEGVEAGLEATRLLERRLALLEARARAWTAGDARRRGLGWPDTVEAGHLPVHGALLDRAGFLSLACAHLQSRGPWSLDELPRNGPRAGIVYSAGNEPFVVVLGPPDASGSRVLAAAEASQLMAGEGLTGLGDRGVPYEIWAPSLLDGDRTLVSSSTTALSPRAVDLPLASTAGAWRMTVDSRLPTAEPRPVVLRVVLALILALSAAALAYEIGQRWGRLQGELRERERELEAAGLRVAEEAELRQRLADQASFNAVHDGLTRLPNQREFVHRVERALARARTGEDNGFCVFVLGLDRFRSVNESLGERRGDTLLTHVAQRLDQAIRPGDTLARVGGDKFGLLLYSVSDERAADLSSKRVLEVMSEPFVADEQEVYLTASIGISIARTGYEDARDLFRQAELAMYQAKGNRHGGSVRFEPETGAELASVVQLETDLRRAIERQEFELYYQPIVATSDGVLHGMEVLIRWNHPFEGVLAPGRFLPLAEDLGLITTINRLVLEKTVEQAVEWRRRFPDNPVYLSFNTTAADLALPEFYDRVGELMEKSELPTGALRLEITESMILEDMEDASVKLQELNERGVWVLLDDFGTGYSSLSYLHQLPIHTLKIDRSFINLIGQRERDLEIVRAIIDMAGALRIRTIAEGIEDEETLDILRRMRCDAVQGYYFSRPAPAAVAEEWLVEPKWVGAWRDSVAS